MQIQRRIKPLAQPIERAARPLGNRLAQAVPDRFDAKAIAASPARAAPSFALPTAGEWTLDDGKPGDPVTFYVHGSLGDLEAALTQGGWSKADPRGLASDLRYVGAAIKQETYKALSWVAKKLDGLEIGIAGVFGLHPKPLFSTDVPYVPGVDRMPVSPQSYRGQPFAAAFEMNNNPLGGRDHLRIFDTGQRDAQGKPVWAIAATRDVGIRFDPHSPQTGFLDHVIQPDVVSERDLVMNSLLRSGAIADLQSFQLPFGGPASNGAYVSDSKGYQLDVLPQAGAVEHWA